MAKDKYKSRTRLLSFIILCILSLFFSINQSLAQRFIYYPTYNADSLLSILHKQDGKERVNSLNFLAVSLSYIDPDTSLIISAEALSQSSQIGYDEGIAETNRICGLIYRYIGNFPRAQYHFLKALDAYIALGNKRKTARVYYDITIMYYFSVNYEKALEYSEKALVLYKEIENERSIGSVKDSMEVIGGYSLIYFLIDSCEKSVQISSRYLRTGLQYNFDERDMFLFHILVGERYECAGYPDSALKYLNLALKYPVHNPDIETLQYRAVFSLGNHYLLAGEIDTAIYFFTQAFEYYNEAGFLFMAMGLAHSLAYAYYINQETIQAEKHYLISESIAKQMLFDKRWHKNDSLSNIASWGLEIYLPIPKQKMREMVWNYVMLMYQMLFKINNESGNSDKALKYHIAFANARDTLNKFRNSQEMIRQQTNFEVERYEREINSLSQQNAIQKYRLERSRYIYYGLAILIFGILLTAFFLIRLNRLKSHHHVMTLQQKLFRSQMNPHFIFNSLTSIQNLILDEEVFKANKYLSRFSKMVRNILESSVDENIPLEQDINTIENYLSLQKIRFPDKFDYEISIDKIMNLEDVLIPPMLLQPFLENAIEHGIKSLDRKGNINIRFSEKDEYVLVEIEDDGIGRAQASRVKQRFDKNHQSMATKLTEERITTINRRRRKKIHMRIEDLKDETGNASGTIVLFEIPI